jgi:ferritin
MISKTMEKALNAQIHEELYSFYLYAAMAAYFNSLKLNGFAHWMKLQAKEEQEHAWKLYGHIQLRGGRVEFDALKKPPKDWKNPLAAFQAAYEHEQHITGCINKLFAQAEKEKDNPAMSFLGWYIDEQVEEEANVEAIIHTLKMIGDNTAGLVMFDKELHAR